MLLRSVTMSNAERQRLFQLRHPGYDARRKARERAMARRTTERFIAARRARAAAEAADADCAAAEAPRPVLMLPAPVEDPMMAEVNALAASLAASRALQPQII
jgi:hypothetical protein